MNTERERKRETWALIVDGIVASVHDSKEAAEAKPHAYKQSFRIERMSPAPKVGTEIPSSAGLTVFDKEEVCEFVSELFLDGSGQPCPDVVMRWLQARFCTNDILVPDDGSMSHRARSSVLALCAIALTAGEELRSYSSPGAKQ